jgi:hypothetical protein
LWYERSCWRAQWWPLVKEMVDNPPEQAIRSRHAVTVRLELPSEDGARGAYLKVYRSPAIGKCVKDWFRPSKAVRALRVSTRLADLGFGVARVLAAGEERVGPALRRSFLLTEELSADPLDRVAARLNAEPRAERRQHKRAILKTLGEEVGRLHDLGFVHGDLLVTNILISRDLPPRLYFIDHDRSRQACMLARQQRRNLIQLNRIELPGVAHSDRLRAFRRYAEVRGWGRARWRSAARELARLTLLRREEIQQLAARDQAGEPTVR